MADKSEDARKEVLKELLLSEEESAAELKRIIERAKGLIRLDAKSKKVILVGQFDYSIPEKVVLVLIGNHFAKELNILENEGLTVTEMEKQTGTVKTTLSGKLGLLKSSGYIGQDEQKRYHILRHKTREIVDALHAKYVEKNEDAGLTLRKPKPKHKKEKAN